MAYLGLDLSLSSTGFFLLRDDGTNKNLSIVTRPDQYDTIMLRVKAIAAKIIEEIGEEKKDLRLALLEDYFIGNGTGGQTVIKLAVLGTIVRDELSRHGIKYVTALPSQIKKFETGKGNVQKDVMIKYVFKNHKVDTNCNDIADACAMAYLCKAYWENAIGTADSVLKYQAEVLKAMGKIVEPY